MGHPSGFRGREGPTGCYRMLAEAGGRISIELGVGAKGRKDGGWEGFLIILFLFLQKNLDQLCCDTSHMAFTK